MDKQNKLGYTLIEILVVISIMGFVIAAVAYLVNSARIKSRDAKRLADMTQIQKALQLYYNDFQSYPVGNNDFMMNDKCNTSFEKISSYLTSGYISKIPDDPNNNDVATWGCYWYQNKKNGKGYIIFMNPEDDNSLQNDFDCYTPGVYYCIGENW